jgi:hypothetical protein
MKSPSLDPKVFVKAAKLLATDDAVCFACCAIDMVAGIDGPHTRYFEDVTRPRAASECHDETWDSLSRCECFPWYGYDWETSNHHARVIGLLLCAELVKDGFKPSRYKRAK